MTLFARWLRFNAGGIYGFLLQLLLLTLLSRRLPLAAATAIAVEAAVIHNFVWHELFTWKERHVSEAIHLAKRALRFQLSNGLISLVGNVAFTTYIRSQLGVPVIAANVAAIFACALLNFAMSEWVVFKPKPRSYPEDRSMMFI